MPNHKRSRFSLENSFQNDSITARPRERLMFYGEKVLLDEELIALVLGTGSTLPIARLLIHQTGGLNHLQKLGISQLCTLPNIGKARACQLKAALELGRRSTLSSSLYTYKVRSAEDIVKLLQPELSNNEQESFHVFGLDTKHKIQTRSIAAIGQIDRVHVSPVDIFRPMIRENMASVIVAHNHPSGDPTPSPQDHILTHLLAQAGRLLSIPLLDHIIIGSQGYYSFSEHGKCE